MQYHPILPEGLERERGHLPKNLSLRRSQAKSSHASSKLSLLPPTSHSTLNPNGPPLRFPNVSSSCHSAL